MKRMLLILAIAAVIVIAFSAWLYMSTGSSLFSSPTPSATPTPTPATSPLTMKVKAYFANNVLDPEISCQEVFPVTRTIAKTAATGRAALLELLKGPTSAEKAQGYTTTIPDDVKLQSLTIANGVARADFDETLERNVGGSCRVAFIRHQIIATLEQFPTITSVIISIDGRTEDILQP